MTPVARAFALRVGATGTRVALRSKYRGRWRAMTWDEIAAILDEPPGPAAPCVPVLDGWAIDAERIAAAEARVQARSLGPADTALIIAPHAWEQHAADIVAEWLVAGFTLAIPETNDSVGSDIRTIRPTYVFAPARTFDAIYAEAAARLPRPGTLQRALVDQVLAGRTSFAHELVRGALRRGIGWGRVRVAAAVDRPLERDAARFFAGLGAPVVPPDERLALSA